MGLMVGVSLFLLIGALFPARWQSPYIIASFFLLFILSAFRGLSVGTDTVNYEQFFMGLAAGREWLRYAMEPAWVLLNEFVISSGGGFRHVVILSTLLALLPIFVIAVQRSKNPMLTIFLYSTLYFYWLSFNITRQAIAVGLVLLGMTFVLERRYFLFSVLVAIASLFHISALVGFALLATHRVSEKRWVLALVVICSMIVGLFGFDYLSALIELTSYRSYIEMYEVGSFLGNAYFLFILNSFFFLVLFSIRNVGSEVKIFFIYIVAQNLLIRVPFGARVVLYFSIFQVLFLPFYLKFLRTSDDSVRVVFGVIVVLYAYAVFFQKFGGGEILPYVNVLFA